MALRPILLLAVLLVGCGSQDYLTPAVAGVVAEIDGTNDATHFALANGQEFTIGISNASVVAYGGGPPDRGDLLLGGTGRDGPWVARLPPDLTLGGGGCYRLDGAGTDRGAWIETDAGFRLPKAESFDPGLVDAIEGARYEMAQDRKFCLNADGQVTSFGL